MRLSFSIYGAIVGIVFACLVTYWTHAHGIVAMAIGFVGGGVGFLAGTAAGERIRS